METSESGGRGLETNKEELSIVVQEKMCVLRSLASVGRCFTKTDVTIDEDMIKNRLAQINKVDNSLQQQLKQIQDEGSHKSTPFLLRLLAIEEILKEGVETDKQNVRELIDKMVQDKDISSSLSAALAGLVVRYKHALSYGDLSRLLDNPNQQVCIVISGEVGRLPSHMAHVQKTGTGDIVSVSDRDEHGKPISLDSLLIRSLFKESFKPSEVFNTIVFSREERVTDDNDERIDNDFLEVGSKDSDLIRAKKQVDSLAAKVIYPPDTSKINEGIYPEATDYQENHETLGHVRPAEAVAMVYVARKAAVLHRSFGHSRELSDLIKRFSITKAAELGMRDKFDIWQRDVSDGIVHFLIGLDQAARARDLGTKTVGETATWKKPEEERIRRQYSEALQRDNNVLSELVCNAAVADGLEIWGKQIPHNPGGAKTPQEIEARFKSHELGLMIGKDLYLKALKLSEEPENSKQSAKTKG